MKPFVLFAKASLCMLALLAGATGRAQNAKEDNKQAAVKQMIDAQRYEFIPSTAMPLSGHIRQLTLDFSLTITKDTIDSYLPYYGRAYVAPTDPTANALQFTSKSFDYKTEPRKKGGWDVTIRPKDYSEVQQMLLTVSTDGYASLQVICTNRQAISFNGYLRAIQQRKKKK